MLWAFYMASIYPLISNYIHQKDTKNLKLIIKTSLIVLVLLAIVIIVIGDLAAPLAINILGGKGFVESILPFRILLLALPFVLLNNILYYLLLSFAKVKWIVLVLIISFILNFSVNIFIIPRYSYLGTSVSTIITEVIISIGYFIVLWKLVMHKADNIF